MTKLTITTVLSLMLAVVLSGKAEAYDEADLEQLKSTNECAGCDLSGANLAGANLEGANLNGARLKAANLKGANLSETNLMGARLEGANLNGANLNGANLAGAELAGANLMGARLEGARLEGTELGEPPAACFALKADAANDVVAQVLNYSTWGNDQESSNGSFWYKAQEGTCRYKVCADEDSDADPIDLDRLDPKSITIGGEIVTDRLLWYEKRREAAVIKYEGKILITSVCCSSVDTERVVRGWALIYDKYCKGTEKPF